MDWTDLRNTAAGSETRVERCTRSGVADVKEIMKQGATASFIFGTRINMDSRAWMELHGGMSGIQGEEMGQQ